MRPIQTLTPYLITTRIQSQQERGLSFGSQDKKSGLGAMPEDTEREAKEKQGQNWPGKKLLPDFSTQMKVAPFVFTNNYLSITIKLFSQPGVSLRLQSSSSMHKLRHFDVTLNETNT